MDKALPYVCSPKLTAYDKLWMNIQLELLDSGIKHGIPERSIMKPVNMLTELTARSPEYLVNNVKSDRYDTFQKKFDRDPSKIFTIHNRVSQLKAMLQHNIFKYFDNSMQKTADIVKSEVYMIVAEKDHILNAQPAIEFAKVLDCDILIFHGSCGHLSIGCEMDISRKIINEFFSSTE